jgi:hypothetical protein
MQLNHRCIDLQRSTPLETLKYSDLVKFFNVGTILVFWNHVQIAVSDPDVFEPPGSVIKFVRIRNLPSTIKKITKNLEFFFLSLM